MRQARSARGGMRNAGTASTIVCVQALIIGARPLTHDSLTFASVRLKDAKNYSCSAGLSHQTAV